MTGEEIIRWLDSLKKDIGQSQHQALWHYAEAIDMAIEALSAEPTAEDLIIKGAKGIQDGLYNIKDGKLFKYKAKGGIVQAYQIVPSSEVQGEWVEEDEYGDLWVCDQCGLASEYKANFCPNCGAMMVREDGEV